jgi:hypothetical protein
MLNSPIVAATGLVAFALTMQPVMAETGTGRYQLHRTGDGFMRLDTETGSVAHCRQKDAKWHCDNLDGGSAASPADVAELKRRNQLLEKRVARLEARLRVEGVPKDESKSRLKLPDDQELDEIMGFFEKFMRRFMDFARTLNEPSGKDI